MKKYEIWSEGYCASGDSAPATLLGVCGGDDFRDACINFANINEPFREEFDSKQMTCWGCRLFDNEADARKSFG